MSCLAEKKSVQFIRLVEALLSYSCLPWSLNAQRSWLGKSEQSVRWNSCLQAAKLTTEQEGKLQRQRQLVDCQRISTDAKHQAHFRQTIRLR